MAERQDVHLRALRASEGIEIVEGKYEGKVATCHVCSNQWQTYEEKMTDVNIAIDLVCDAEDDEFDAAILISGDGDLTGPVERVLSRHPRKRVIVGFPPRRTSDSLKSTASAHFWIRGSSLRNSQLPDMVQAVDGYPLRRPAEWS